MSEFAFSVFSHEFAIDVSLQDIKILEVINDDKVGGVVFLQKTDVHLIMFNGCHSCGSDNIEFVVTQ